jgi:outer membrane protein insertion porin family
VLGPHVSLGGDLFGKETFASSYQSYNSTFYGAKIVTAAPLTEQLGMSWSYSIYNQNLTLPSGPPPRCRSSKRRPPARCGCPRSAPA